MKQSFRFYAIALVAMMVLMPSCKKDSVQEPPTVTTHELVDLGLPSGTLWATCNVGASNPEDLGDFFAWGETAPKEIYDWASYPYGDCIDNCFKMTKYCDEDSLSVLEPSDDAATANWGDDWRMPTMEEWEELYQKTTYIWTDVNGVYGRLLTGYNGNSIFLPAAGFRLNDGYYCPNLGLYWASTRHYNCTERGWSYHFDYETSHVCGTYERNQGQVVRAVRR